MFCIVSRTMYVHHQPWSEPCLREFPLSGSYGETKALIILFDGDLDAIYPNDNHYGTPLITPYSTHGVRGKNWDEKRFQPSPATIAIKNTD